MPVQFFSQCSTDERADKRAEIYSHVKYAKPGISSRAAFRIKFANHRAYIWLEHAGSDHDEDQADVESFSSRYRKHEVASGDNHASIPNRSLRPQESVGEPSTGQRCEVNRRGVKAVNGSRRFVS